MNNKESGVLHMVKQDDECRSGGRKIDLILSLRGDEEEFSVAELKINPQEDIRLIKLYGIQSYLCELIVYEFQLKYLEIYMAKEVLRIPIPRTWKDMIRAHETISGLLKYEYQFYKRFSLESKFNNT
ncbi:15914_t:CDS:2 [Entrophospora sp. SA101]|nr:15914_t:CDS:2 [Entrophospora sp. SA101]